MIVINTYIILLIIITYFFKSQKKINVIILNYMIYKKKNVLIIGYGSIGQRHTKILISMGVNVHIYSRRNIDFASSFDNLKQSFKEVNYDYVIIANRTSEHFATLVELKKLNYKGVVMIEKPIFDHYIEFKDNTFKKIIVAFNLRLYPAIQELKKKISNEKILSVNAYAGQYLPYWRPNVDYRTSYSASKKGGGGVLLDLSHEIDYLNWILEGLTEVISSGGKFSDLEIDSDDIFQISFKSKRCQLVQLELNYIDKVLRRFIIINTNQHTYKADLIASTLEIDGQIIKFKNDRNYSYKKCHEQMFKKNYTMMCSYQEAIQNMKILESIRTSNIKKKWININKGL